MTELWLYVCILGGTSSVCLFLTILIPCPLLGTFNPYSADPLPASPKKQLILKIISGQQLPKPPDSMLGDRGEVRYSDTIRCFNERPWSDMTDCGSNKLSPYLNIPINFQYCQAFGH